MFRLLLAFAIGLALFEATIRSLNLRQMLRHGRHIPPGFETALDDSLMTKMSAYGADRGRLSLCSNLSIQVLIIIAVFGGAFEHYDRWISQLTHAPVAQGVLYCLFASWTFAVITIPFELYGHFVIEQHHGFNRSSVGLYWSDFVKGLALTSLFVSILAACALYLIQWSTRAWWVWVWAFLLVFELFVTLVAPRLIEPLFMKVKPLHNQALVEDISAMAARAGVRVDRILQVDASRRSGHTNAYFTGIGPVKRVVLFDTLLEKLDHKEILAVLAHELGHWKLRHVMQSFALFQGFTLAACYGAFRLINWEPLPGVVGAVNASFLMRATITLFIGSLVATCLTPCMNAWSRRNEWQADKYACSLVEPGDLASGLVKLCKDNLANLYPHALYAAFYGTHPTTVARVQQLKGAQALHSLSQQELSVDLRRS